MSSIFSSPNISISTPSTKRLHCLSLKVDLMYQSAQNSHEPGPPGNRKPEAQKGLVNLRGRLSYGPLLWTPPPPCPASYGPLHVPSRLLWDTSPTSALPHLGHSTRPASCWTPSPPLPCLTWATPCAQQAQAHLAILIQAAATQNKHQ